MCGVVGIIGTPEAAKEVFMALLTLQHRGQDAAGILSYNNDKQDLGNTGFHLIKNTGLISSVFNEQNIERLSGSMAIGHTRYSTVGTSEARTEVQPFLINFPYGIGMVHNGNVVNYLDVTAKLKREKQRTSITSSDLEVIQNLFAEALVAEIDQQNTEKLSIEAVTKAVQSIYVEAKGAFSVVSMIAEQGLVAFRDPQGIRPLILGEKSLSSGKKSYCITSEAIALNFLGYEVVRDLKAGELIYITDEGEFYSRVLCQETAYPCMLEWVYFAGAESTLENKAVYGARINLGAGLGKQIRKLIDSGEMAPDVVVPVPETARIAAVSLAEEIKVPYRELFIKNRYIHRSFILNTQDKRDKAVNLKLSPVRSELKGKNVLLVDDSIVRGTTSRRLIDLARKAGAKNVYFASTCPPIRFPCYYGIDFPNPSELLATDRNVDQIAQKLNADKVVYLDQKGLESAIGLPTMCSACLDEKYPNDVSSGKKFREQRIKHKSSGAP